jgi:hypothetical protein
MSCKIFPALLTSWSRVAGLILSSLAPARLDQ